MTVLMKPESFKYLLCVLLICINIHLQYRLTRQDVPTKAEITFSCHLSLLLLPAVKYYARWPTMVSYFPPISSLNIQLIFVHLADNIKSVLGFLLYSFVYVGYNFSCDPIWYNLMFFI